MAPADACFLTHSVQRSCCATALACLPGARVQESCLAWGRLRSPTRRPAHHAQRNEARSPTPVPRTCTASGDLCCRFLTHRLQRSRGAAA